MNTSNQLINDLKAAATVSSDPTIQLRAAVPSYKAMSHLATVLGALPKHESDPTYAARIEKLRRRRDNWSPSWVRRAVWPRRPRSPADGLRRHRERKTVR